MLDLQSIFCKLFAHETRNGKTCRLVVTSLAPYWCEDLRENWGAMTLDVWGKPIGIVNDLEISARTTGILQLNREIALTAAHEAAHVAVYFADGCRLPETIEEAHDARFFRMLIHAADRLNSFGVDVGDLDAHFREYGLAGADEYRARMENVESFRFLPISSVAKMQVPHAFNELFDTETAQRWATV